MSGNLQKRIGELEIALAKKRNDFNLAKENAEKWTHRATTHESNLKKKSEEIASLQQVISVLKNQLTTEALQYESMHTELVLKTNECNTLEEKVKVASKVNESLAVKFQDKQQENNELQQENNQLKRKFEAVSSARDSLASESVLLRKKLKSANEAYRTADATSPAMEKSAFGNQPYSEESFIFSHQTEVDSDDEESCDDDNSVSSTDESTSSDISMSDDETEFSTPVSDSNNSGSVEGITETSISSNFGSENQNAADFSEISESSDNGSSATISSSNLSSCSVDHEAVQRAEESAKLAEVLFFPECFGYKKIPIEKRSLISQEDMDRNIDARNLKDSWLKSDSMRFSDAAGYSKEARKTLPNEIRSYLAKSMPEPIVQTFENRHMHTTQLMEEAFLDESFCDVLIYIFIETGQIPVGIFSIGDSVKVCNAKLVMFFIGTFNPAKAEDVMQNSSMSFLQKFLIEISEELGIEISAFNIDILQLAYGSKLGTDLREDLKSHPQIQKMFRESNEFYQLCREKLFPIVFKVINKMVDKSAVKVLCDYHSKGTIEKFSEINKDVPSFIKKIMDECQIPEANRCKINHACHFIQAKGKVATTVYQNLLHAVWIICNAMRSSCAQKQDTDTGMTCDEACSSDAQKPDFDTVAIVTRMGIREEKKKKTSGRFSLLKNFRFHLGSEDVKSEYYIGSKDVESKSMGIFEIEQKARKEGWNMHIPKGKGLREGIQYCAHQGTKLGSSGLHINKTDAGLKAIIFKSPAKPSAKPSARPSHPTSSKPSEAKSKKFCKFIDEENDAQCIKVPQGGCNGYCWEHYDKKTCKSIDSETNVQCQEIEAYSCKGYCKEHRPNKEKKTCKFIDEENDAQCIKQPQHGCNGYCWEHYDKKTCKSIDSETNVQCQEIEAYSCKGYCKEHRPNKEKKTCKFIDEENDAQCIKQPQGGCNGYCWKHYDKKTCKSIDSETNVQCQEIEAYSCKGYCEEHRPNKEKKTCKFIDEENDAQCIKVPQGGCNGYCWEHYDKKTCKSIDSETNVQCQEIEACHCKGYCKEHRPNKEKKTCKFIDEENDAQCIKQPQHGCNGYCWEHYDKKTCKSIDSETNVQCQEIEAYSCKGYCKEHRPNKEKKTCKFIDEENDAQCIKQPQGGCNGYCWEHYDKKTCKSIDSETNVQCQEIEAYSCKGYCKEHRPNKEKKTCKFIDEENDAQCIKQPQHGCNGYCWEHY